MKTTYYVYRPGGNSPAVAHETLAEAQKEAERLAIKHCCEVHIVSLIGVSKPSGATTEWMLGADCGNESQQHSALGQILAPIAMPPTGNPFDKPTLSPRTVKHPTLGEIALP